MSLAERSQHQPGRAKHGMPCSVAELLDNLPPTESDALRSMLNAPWRVWPHVAIEKAIRDEGHFVGVGAIGKHRRGACRCDEPG